MGEGTGILPGLPAVAGKPVHIAFDGGRVTSDAGILLLAAIEQRLKVAERLAACMSELLISGDWECDQRGKAVMSIRWADG